MEFTIGKKVVELKFDYRLMYKINKQMGSKNAETGQSNNDGVGALFLAVVERDDSGLVQLVQLCGSEKGKDVTEEMALAAIEDYFDKSGAEDAQEALFAELEREMVESGFFKKKILKYIEQLKKASKAIALRAESEELAELQEQELQATISKMEDALS